MNLTLSFVVRLALLLGATQGFSLVGRAQIEVISDGKVGVGTNAPARVLHLVDTSNDTQLRLGGGTRDIAVESSTGAGIGQIISVGNVAGQSRYQFGDGTMTLRGGKVGVGIAAPAGLIDIWNYYSSGVDSLRLSYNDGLPYWMGIQPYVVGSGNVGYRFRTNNISTTTDALAITGDGNVGLGTTSPAQKLEVIGAVKATSFVSATTTYADFVFDPAYRLPALSEIETHIKEHGRLPGIPSEAEVRRDGIDLAAMQVKLLQKIEELTLHIIRQEKEISVLRAQLSPTRSNPQ